MKVSSLGCSVKKNTESVTYRGIVEKTNWHGSLLEMQQAQRRKISWCWLILRLKYGSVPTWSGVMEIVESMVLCWSVGSCQKTFDTSQGVIFFARSVGRRCWLTYVPSTETTWTLRGSKPISRQNIFFETTHSTLLTRITNIHCTKQRHTHHAPWCK